MTSRNNIAARAGRWSATHCKTAVLGWLAFVLVAVVLGSAAGTKTIVDEERGTGESGRADRTLAKAFPQDADESVIVQSRNSTVDEAEFQATVREVIRRVSAVPAVANVRSPLERGNQGQISDDRKSALVTLEIRGDSERTKEQVGAVLAATAAAQKAHPQLRVEQFGDASADAALSKSFDDDLRKAETISLPVTLAILLVAFGALVAAGVPLLLGATAVASAIGLVGLVSQVTPVDESINSVILLIGLAVGVDYSLFYLRRAREERAAGRSEPASLEAAAATSGRAVLVSGLTVMAAMAGMYLTGSSTFSSFATGTIIVVAVAVIGSLTVLPAVLSKLGDRVERGRVPLLGRRRRGGEPRLWAALLDRVLRRPVVSALAAGGVLVALAIPAFGLHTALPGYDSLPRDLPVMRAYDRIQAAFPGGQIPAVVVVEAKDVTAPGVERAIAGLRSRALATGRMMEPVQVSVSRDRSVANVAVPMVGDGTDERSNAALADLRERIIPATVGSLPGVRADVTGATAGTKDFNDLMKSHAPIVFAFVLAMAFGLLLVTFRSIVIPLKAIALNLLSVGAAYGVLVLVFQEGWGESLIGFESNGAITSWLPLFLFVILFGLSMDYHVFILSRVREAFDRGMTTADAVAHGIKSTAGVVTSAAVVMVAVFAIFAMLGMLEMKQMGVGLAAAILIDATIIRGVLLPATMKLLGDWNWYLPRRLRWLPEVGREPEVEAAKA